MTRNFSSSPITSLIRGATLGSFLLLCACATGPKVPEWPPTAKKWFDRAEHSYRVGDLDDARLASENALSALPAETRVKMVAAKVALAELEFERALQLLRGMPGSEAAGLRGRSQWYLGHLEEAADELSQLSSDPDVKDIWATDILKLARDGRGRRPFEMSGGLVAAVEMPRAGSTAMLVPLEVNGEPALAMIATDRAEAVIDSREHRGGEWVSLRFGGQLEVSDVPAVSQDLSGLEREIGAPIKMLIGVHLLRRLRATIDLAGRQFVVRNYEPPPPPQATTVNPIYYRGGAMVLPSAFGTEQSAPTSTLLVNTSMTFPLALDEEGWKKGGQDPGTFVAVPGGGDLRQGILPMLRLGSFEIPSVPGVLGAPIGALEKEVGVDLDGFAGSGLFATFRLTFADGGRTLWMEDLPPEVIELRRQALQEMRSRRAAAPSDGSAPGRAPASTQQSSETPNGSSSNPLAPANSPAPAPARAPGKP